MNPEILLSEFEWYLRDYFFRINNKDNNAVKKRFSIKEISEYLHKNYLRYKSWELDQINEFLDKALAVMNEKKAIMKKTGDSHIELYSNFDRKQCGHCFYINYLSINEEIKCQRCKSIELKDFPIQKYKVSSQAK